MRKWICGLLCLLLFSGCSNTEKEVQEPVEIDAQEVVDRLQSQKTDTFLLYITTTDCYSCDEYYKVVEELQDEKAFTIYYLTIDLNESDEDVKEALTTLGVTIGDYTTFPMTYYFYKGTLQPENIKEGYIEKGDYEKWLKDLHII